MKNRMHIPAAALTAMMLWVNHAAGADMLPDQCGVTSAHGTITVQAFADHPCLIDTRTMYMGGVQIFWRQNRIDLAKKPKHGQAYVADNGGIIYTPNRGFAGHDMVVYRVTDGNISAGTADHLKAVAINVKPSRQ